MSMTRIRATVVTEINVKHLPSQDDADVCALVKGEMTYAYENGDDPFRARGEPDRLVSIDVETVRS